MSSTTNIPINTRSMNGIITISDGIATMENGNLTNVDNLDANNMNSAILTTTTQPPNSNNNDVATTAYVYNELIDYALLNPITQTFTGINIFGTLQASTPSINTNSVRVATTAYVKTNLLNYGLLNPVTPQTFSGSNNFSTQLITDNSTLCATTAYVKNQNYITSLSLAGYALLNPPTTQIWGNAITPQENWWYGDTFSYAGIESVNGFRVKSDPGPTPTTYALIDSIGSISTTSTIDSIGIISSDTGFNIPRISPLTTINNNGTISQTSTGTNSLFNTTFTGTSNQINIKAFVNT